MIFNSFQYILFLGGVVAFHWALRRVWQQNLLLLVGGYLFYAAWDWRFLALLGFTTLVNYTVSRLLARWPPGRWRTVALVAGLAANLGVLGFFKYFNFFAESAVSLLTALGIQANPPGLQIILPVGISFFTFQAMAYLIDAHSGQVTPTRSLLNFALYTAFFPQLTAGPIERAVRLLPQVERPRTLTPERVEEGLALILLGMFKKVVIADVAASLIEPGFFATPADYPPAQVMVGVYLFALQIYGDFSGYSDIARGSASLLGFALVENFNQPYFSQTVSEFWRRWHISLSLWLRDYLFFPISRALLRWGWPSLPVYALATLITMLLAGLWHGAAWTYVLWGGLLGLYLVGARLLAGKALRWRKHRRVLVRLAVAGGSILLTFHLILIAWVVFRAPSLASAAGVYQQWWAALGQGADLLALGWLPLALYAVSFIIDAGQVWAGDHAFTRRLSLPVGSLVYVAALLLIIVFSVKPYVPFFYFQF